MSWIQNFISLRILIYSIFWSLPWFLVLSVSFSFLSIISMSLPCAESFPQMSGHLWLSLCTQGWGTRKWVGGFHAGWWLDSKLPFPLEEARCLFWGTVQFLTVVRFGEVIWLACPRKWWVRSGPRASVSSIKHFPRSSIPGPSSRYLKFLVGWIFLFYYIYSC